MQDDLIAKNTKHNTMYVENSHSTGQGEFPGIMYRAGNFLINTANDEICGRVLKRFCNNDLLAVHYPAYCMTSHYIN